MFEPIAIRKDFPILAQKVGKRDLIYLDNAATAQKPQCVIDAISRFYATENANIHRGLYHLSAAATTAFELARERVATFFNAPVPESCVFTRGATESINLVASSWGRANLRAGDEILLTELEHHANIVPWQIIAEQTGAIIRVAKIVPATGTLDLEHWKSLLSEKTKIACFCHISNALGTVNPVKEMVACAHAAGALVLVDGAQSAPHLPVDLQALDCDFFVCSGHKIFGPTGIGVLFGKLNLLNAMSPYQAGGDMIDKVSFAGTTFRDAPARFEAGTPNICGAVGLGVALDYYGKIRVPASIYEHELTKYAFEKLSQIEGMRFFGPAGTGESAGILSFHLGKIHPSDLATMLDTYGICTRVGHHCAMPVMAALGVTGTLRASLAFYNTRAEIDAFADALVRIKQMF